MNPASEDGVFVPIIRQNVHLFLDFSIVKVDALFAVNLNHFKETHYDICVVKLSNFLSVRCVSLGGYMIGKFDIPIGRLLWWTRKKSVKPSALGRLCRKGCCAVCVKAGCLSSISGGMTQGKTLEGAYRRLWKGNLF